MGDYIGDYYWTYEGATRSLDYSLPWPLNVVFFGFYQVWFLFWVGLRATKKRILFEGLGGS